MLELPDLAALTSVRKNDLIRALYRRLMDLEARVRKDSHNSSKPPFSDGLSADFTGFSTMALIGECDVGRCNDFVLSDSCSGYLNETNPAISGG